MHFQEDSYGLFEEASSPHQLLTRGLGSMSHKHGVSWGFPWHGDSPPLGPGIQEIALLKSKSDLMTWSLSHCHLHCFLFNRNETVTESSLHGKAVELGSIFWRKKCEEFMDTLYTHHRQDAVARSNEAGESTVAGGTHLRHCYRKSLLSCSCGGDRAGIFVWR